MTHPAPHPPYPEEFVRAVCDVLAQTEFPGLTGSEIDRILAARQLEKRSAQFNKREGLFYVLYNAQVPNQSGGPVVGFINAAMKPLRYTNDPLRFEALRGQLNEVMIFHALAVSDQGKVTRAASAASTLSERARLLTPTENRARNAN